MLRRRPAHDGRRWFGLAALALVASALIPAALALACNPQAYLTLDKSQYAPGESVRVSGSFFKNNAAVTVSIDRTAQSATVTTSGNGAFQATFALPASAPSGGYSVTAIGYEPNGDVVAGLPARGSFSVGPATPAPSADTTAPSSSQQAAAPAPAAATPQASRPSRAPSSSTPSSGFRAPQVVDEPDVQKSSSTNRSTTAAGASRSSDRATSNGRAVFSGSVAPVPSISAGTPVAAATTAGAPTSRATGAATNRSSTASASRGTSSQVAEQTATDDLWGALSPGRSPSVLPVAGDGVSVSSPRSGSQLALGAMLLGAGMLALIGGLAAGEVRRRRVRAR